MVNAVIAHIYTHIYIYTHNIHTIHTSHIHPIHITHIQTYHTYLTHATAHHTPTTCTHFRYTTLQP